MAFRQILSSAFFGAGVSVILFANIDNLPTPAYYTNILFWPLAVLPSGILWKQKFLNIVNQGQFPKQMKSYRQLFLYSKKAIIYEFFLNQVGYHTMLGISYMAFTYYMRTLYDTITPRKKFSELMSQSIFGFFKLRFLFATVSLLTEFWGAKLSLRNEQGNIRISTQAKRLLLLKQTLLSLFWMASVAQLVHNNYPRTALITEKTKQSQQIH